MLRAVILLAGLSLAATSAAEGPKWEDLFEEEGILVSRRDIPGTSLVEFRGRGEVGANIVRVAAVIRDDSRKTEWMKNCAGAATIEVSSGGKGVIYNRTASPVPLVSDRDIVLDARAEVVAAKKQLHMLFQKGEHAKMPPIDGVVRMPQLKGHWILTQLGPERTHIEYQVQADPGGALPTWVVNWVNKKLPYHTIAKLREQAKKPGYEKMEQIVLFSFDWTGFEVPAGAE